MVKSLLNILIAGCAIGISAAQDAEQKTQEEPQKPEPTEKTATDLVKEQPVSRPVEDDPYANNARAKLFAEQLAGAPEGERDALYVKVAHELIRAGDFDTAAVDLSEWLGDTIPPVDTLTNDQRAAWQLLATAELRRAMTAVEQNGEPLVLAVPDDGTLDEVDRESLDNAANIFAAFATENDEDYESRWLLNLSRVMAGDYPEGVAEPLRIPDLLRKRTPFFTEFTRISLTEVGYASAVLWADVSGDGQPDLLRLSVRDGLSAWDRGGEVLLELGFASIAAGGIGLSAADIDNDGSLEILIIRDQNLPNTLLTKEGDRYRDVTREAGLLSSLSTSNAAWADYDRDGWIDLVVANGEEPLQLFRNQGDGTFLEATEIVGIGTQGQQIDHLDWADIDDDGWPDLILSPRGKPIEVLRGMPSETPSSWRFSDAAISLGIEAIGGGPVWTWDFDNDGALDFGCVSDGKVKLFRNDGDGFSFTDFSGPVELDVAVGEVGAVVTTDLDNDGFLDLIVGTGGDTLAALAPNRVFWNRGADRFREVTLSGGFGLLDKTPSIAAVDLAGDGDVDLVAAMGGRYEGDTVAAVAFENPGLSEHGSISIKLNPPDEANSFGIGAKIEMTVRSKDWIQQDIHRVVSTPGPQLIGIGPAKKIESIRVTWPMKGGPTEELPVPGSENKGLTRN